MPALNINGPPDMPLPWALRDLLGLNGTQFGCGSTVNPGTVAARMEGGIVFGLSAALWGELSLAQGRVQQSNFQHQRVMRINEAPRIEVRLVPGTQAPGGAVQRRFARNDSA